MIRPSNIFTSASLGSESLKRSLGLDRTAVFISFPHALRNDSDMLFSQRAWENSLSTAMRNPSRDDADHF